MGKVWSRWNSKKVAAIARSRYFLQSFRDFDYWPLNGGWLLTTRWPLNEGSTVYRVGCSSGAPRAKRASGAPWVSKSTHPRKFGNHVIVHRPFVHTTGQTMFNFTLSSSFGSIGKLILHTYCTSMLWSIDSCRNRVSANQYHLTLSRAYVSARRGRVFFEVIRWRVTSFKWSQAQV